MAFDTTSLSVSPNNEQDTIQVYQTFGWELQSSQEIFNRDSHLERRGNWINNVTTTTNYVKLVFKRDQSIPHYNELVNLEREYYNIPLPNRNKLTKWLRYPLIFWGAMGVYGAFGGFKQGDIGGALLMILFFCLPGFGIPLLVKYLRNQAYLKAKGERNKVLQKAKAIR